HSPFFSSRAGMMVEKSWVWMVAVRPILAAMAFAMSTSKPTALLLAVSIDSWGGYVVSDRNVIVPAVMRLVGALIVAGLGDDVPEDDVPVEPPQPASVR